MGTKTKVSPGKIKTSSLARVFRRDLELTSSIKSGSENKELRVFIVSKSPVFILQGKRKLARYDMIASVICYLFFLPVIADSRLLSMENFYAL
jgi:hypothetical protein